MITINQEKEIYIKPFSADEFLTNRFQHPEGFLNSLLRANNMIVLLRKRVDEGEIFILQCRFPFRKLSGIKTLFISFDDLREIDNILQEENTVLYYQLGRQKIERILQSIQNFKEAN